MTINIRPDAADKMNMEDDSFLEFLAWLHMRTPHPSIEVIQREMPRIETWMKMRPDLELRLNTILKHFEFNMWSGWIGREFDEITHPACRTHQMRLLAMSAHDTLAFMMDPQYRYCPAEQPTDGMEGVPRRTGKSDERPPVSIIIPAWNQWTFTQLTLNSLFSKTVWPDFEVIVIDNGSADETPAGLEALARIHPALRIIRNAQNIGFSGANNQGVEAARHEHLLFLNNDVVIHHADWIGQLMRSFLVHPRVGATGQFGVLDCFDGDREELYQKVFFPGASIPVSWLSGYNVLTSRRALKDAGGWRGDLYGAAGYEDIHLGYAFRDAGWLCVSPCEIPLIEHLIGRTRFTDEGKAFVSANSPSEDKHRIFCRHFGSRRYRPAA